MAAAGLDPHAYPNWLGGLQVVAAMFFRMTGERTVKLRLETTNDDGCRRYHVERSCLRLLCTYRGKGTEWLGDAQVDRAALGARAPNERIVRFGGPSRLGRFWVGLFKGSLHPHTALGGLVHRSPPIAGTGQLRVRLCLDC